MNKDCGFFKWEEDVEMNIIEKNKILEGRLEGIIVEIDRMRIKAKNMKAIKGGKLREE